MDLNIKNPNSLPEPKPISKVSSDLPTIVGEQKIFIAIPNDEKTKAIYKTLYDNITIYLKKIPSSPAKSAVQKLLDRDLIYIGRNISSNGKNGIIGRIQRTSANRLAGVVIDIVEMDIDPNTGETIHIDQTFYTAYYQFVRAATLINFNKIKDDKRFHQYLIKYMYYLNLRIIGSNISLTSRQKLHLELLSSYFFYRFQLNFNHIQSRENAIEYISTETKTEMDESASILINRLEKYLYMKDIFKGLVDFSITSDSPAALIMRSLMYFKLTGFYSITTTLDYLIAACIVSMYPVSFLQNTLVSKDLQSKIEELITPLINSVKFDTVILSKL